MPDWIKRTSSRHLKDAAKRLQTIKSAIEDPSESLCGRCCKHLPMIREVLEELMEAREYNEAAVLTHRNGLLERDNYNYEDAYYVRSPKISEDGDDL